MNSKIAMDCSRENRGRNSATEISLQFEDFLVEDKSDSDSEDEYDEDGGDEGNLETNNELSIDALNDYNIPSTSHDCILKSKEVNTIESCQHKELKELLLMNRSKNYALMQLFKKVKDLLIKCRSDIESLLKISAHKEAEESYCLLLSYLAAPYFKTRKHMISSFPNKDTITRKKNGQLSVYQTAMSPKWSKNECDNLISIVKLTYNHNRQKSILKQITSLKLKLAREYEESSKTATENEIHTLREELQNIEKEGNKIPPLGSDEFIDWDYISQEYLDGKHSGSECRSFWHVYLHPEINKSNWTAEENEEILQLVNKHKAQDWDQIALKLGTKRSGFSVCLHYLNVLFEHAKRVRFTKEEDELILQHVEKMRIGSYIPWNAFDHVFPNRSRNSVIHRYKYFLSQKQHDVRPFTDAEDILLLILVERYGRNYSQFYQHFKDRSYMQVKSRYDTRLLVSNTLNHFTIEEDQTIMKFVSSQNFKNFGSLAKLMNRKRGQIRQRYLTLSSFLEKNPHLTLDKAPRRIMLNIDYRKLDFLKRIADQFKDDIEIPTIEEIEDRLGIKQNFVGKKFNIIDESSSIDSLLTNFFSNSYKFKQKPQVLSVRKIQEAADTIYSILKNWKVQLKIPEELAKNNFLDVIDLEILGLLKDKYNCSEVLDSSTHIDDIIPPNTNSLVGLRGLMLKNHIYKGTKDNQNINFMGEIPLIRNQNDCQLATELIDMVDVVSEELKNQIETERSLFISRFISLYMWPGVLSIESPCVELVRSELSLGPKKYKKDNRNENEKESISSNGVRKKAVSDEPVSKKRKIEKVMSTSTSCRRSARLKFRDTKTRKYNFSLSSDDENSDNDITPLDETPSEINNLNNTTNTSTIEPSVVKLKKLNDAKDPISKEDEPSVGEVPTNLRRVDKSEIENMLKNKKPVKMFLIQKIKSKDGSIRTIAKPLSQQKLPTSPQVRNDTKTVSTNKSLSVIDHVSKHSSKKEFVKEKVSSNLANTKKTYSIIKITKSTVGNTETPKKITSKDEEDVSKLDAFLKNCEEDSFRRSSEKEAENSLEYATDKPIKQYKFPISKTANMTNNAITKLINGSNILDVISFADSVKRDLGMDVPERKSIETTKPLDIGKLSSNLKNNLKQNVIINTELFPTVTYSRKPAVKINKTEDGKCSKIEEDVSKLNTFLENYENEDCGVSIEENTQHDVDLLNDLIRSKSAFD